jgi:hypothetical protein
MTDPTADGPEAVPAARDLLERVRRRERTAEPRRTLTEATHGALEEIRSDPQRGLAFWLNVYNAATQLLLADRPDLFESRWRFFRAPAITVAGVELSLDDIEHGILRGGRSKYGLGYLPRLARTGLPEEYRLDPDPRIHFALNCGAESCPAILVYDAGTVDGALDDATALYLERTVEYDARRNRVRLPRVCLWFVGDFGGPSGLRSLLREFELIPPGASPSLRFDSYDWSRVPRNFAE